MINVTIYNEYTDGQRSGEVLRAYPDTMHGTIAAFLNAQDGISTRTATLDQPEHGLSKSVLDSTDVLIWWGHCAHDKVSNEVSATVVNAVHRGMGAIFLHSAHLAKPFVSLMGTSCSLSWREAAEREHLIVCNPSHPIAEGIDKCVSLPHEEMYGEPFDIPEPESTVFLSWFKGGNAFRGGVTYRRGRGKVFYFQPGHETHPTFHNKDIQKIIVNAVRWAAPKFKASEINCPNETQPRESID